MERDLFDLSGVRAVVTGSSRGIGLGIARALLRQGACVLINGYDSAETEDAVEVLRKQHAPRPVGSPRLVAGLPGDVTDPAVAGRLVGEAVNLFGGLDHLVCNAGIDIIKRAVDYSPREWDRILAVNLRGAFQPAQAAARHWIAQGHGGSITMTSSIAGAVGRHDPCGRRRIPRHLTNLLLRYRGRVGASRDQLLVGELEHAHVTELTPVARSLDAAEWELWNGCRHRVDVDNS